MLRRFFAALTILFVSIAANAQTLGPAPTQPGGSNTQVQFNDSSAFGGDAGLTYNKTTDILTAVGGVTLGTVSSATGALALANSASAFLTTIQAGNAAAARTYTWPTNFGSAGAMLTDAAGNGTLSWTVPASGITIGTTTITSGTNTRILYDNAGVVGEYTITGTGTVVVMQTSPSLVTPALGVATATSLAIGGATIGGNALAVTGTALFNSATTLGAALTYGGVTLSNAVTGTGNMVLSAAPTLTTSITHGAGPSILTSPSAAVTQLGAADVSSGAVAQTLQVQSNSGASTTGPDFSIVGSGGTTVGGALLFQTKVTTSATTQMSLTPNGSVAFPLATSSTKALKIGTTDAPVIYNSASNLWIISSVGSNRGIQTAPNGNYDLSLSTHNNQFMSSPGAGILQLGQDTFNGDASAQILQAQGSTKNSATPTTFTILAGDNSGTGTNGNALTVRAGNATGASGTRNGGAVILAGGTGASVGGTISFQTAATTSLTTALGIDAAGLITYPTIASDATHTDATVCVDTTTKGLYQGSGTLGICLGTSGRQFKTAFGVMPFGLAEVMRLPLQSYNYISGYGDGGARRQYGLTAQDVERVIPELVRHNDHGDTINYDAGALLFVALRAIQELKADNDNLRALVQRRAAK